MFSDIVLGLASIGAFNKLQFYILKYHKGNKNMLICIEMYGVACTSCTVG